MKTSKTVLADGVLCGVNHSGPNTLTEMTWGHWQCDGCGQSYTTAQVRLAGEGIRGADKLYRQATIERQRRKAVV